MTPQSETPRERRVRAPDSIITGNERGVNPQQDSRYGDRTDRATWSGTRRSALHVAGQVAEGRVPSLPRRWLPICRRSPTGLTRLPEAAPTRSIARLGASSLCMARLSRLTWGVGPHIRRAGGTAVSPRPGRPEAPLLRTSAFGFRGREGRCSRDSKRPTYHSREPLLSCGVGIPPRSASGHPLRQGHRWKFPRARCGR